MLALFPVWLDGLETDAPEQRGALSEHVSADGCLQVPELQEAHAGARCGDIPRMGRQHWHGKRSRELAAEGISLRTKTAFYPDPAADRWIVKNFGQGSADNFYLGALSRSEFPDWDVLAAKYTDINGQA